MSVAERKESNQIIKQNPTPQNTQGNSVASARRKTGPA